MTRKDKLIQAAMIVLGVAISVVAGYFIGSHEKAPVTLGSVAVCLAMWLVSLLPNLDAREIRYTTGEQHRNRRNAWLTTLAGTLIVGGIVDLIRYLIRT